MLQSVPHMSTDANGKDPWWTLLCFSTHCESLVVRRLSWWRTFVNTCVYSDRGWDYKLMRNTMPTELTSRVRSDDIPKELAKLEIHWDLLMVKSEGLSVDVCLASNVIEVGVDLPRLSLMSIVGQPKSTSPVHSGVQPRWAQQG